MERTVLLPDYYTEVNFLLKSGLFLEDVLTPSSFQRGTFNLVVAPCGSGKTTAAINTIAALASSPHKALLKRIRLTISDIPVQQSGKNTA